MPKNLYIADSISALNDKIVDVPDENLPRLTKSANRLYDAAIKAEKEDDEERAYILFMRFYSIFDTIRKKPQYTKDRAYYDKIISVIKAKESITKAEKFRVSLEKRYNLKREAQEREDEENAIRINEETKTKENKKKVTSSNGISKVDSMKMSPNVLPSIDDGPFISVPSLKALISQRSTDFHVLDIRTTEDYKKSHINIPQIFNIPEQILQKGQTAETLSAQIDSSARLMWARRGRVDKLIIIDWFTDKEPYPEPVKLLLDSMLKWDPGTTYKSLPVILKGGYDMWLMSYPQYTTNPKVEVPPQNKLPPNPVSTSLITLDFSYSDLDTAFIKTPDNKSVDTASNGYPSLSLTNGTTESPTLNNYPPLTGVTLPYVVNGDVMDSPSKRASPIPTTTFPAHIGPSPSKSLTSTFPRADRTAKQNTSSGIEATTGNSLNYNSTFNNNNIVPSSSSDLPRIPNRALKPKHIMASMKGKLSEETKLMEDTVELEKKALSKLSELEQSNNSITINKLQDELNNMKNMISRKEDNFDKISSENKELKAAIANLLAVSKTNNNTNMSGSADPIQAGQDNSFSGAQIISRVQDQTARDELNNVHEKHEELKRQVDRLRKERKEKEQKILKQNKLDEQKKKQQLLEQQQSKNEFQSISGGAVTGGNRTYNATLKGPTRGGSPPRSTNLRRSHSAYNLSQLDESLDFEVTRRDATNSSVASVPSQPSYDRSSKPFHAKKLNLNSARSRDFGAVGGNCKRSGLKNLGNTCYQNAIIQCLVTINPFARYFVHESYFEHLNSRSPQKGEVAEEFGAVVKALKSKKYKTLQMKDLKRVAGKYCSIFRGNDHHDSHEFLMKLADWLHDDLNIARRPNTPLPEQNFSVSTPDYIAAEQVMRQMEERDKSIMRTLFYGLHRNVINCSSCRSRSLTFEPFFALSLSIPTSGRSTLPHLLQDYYRESEVPYTCEKCGHNRKGIRKMDIWELPPVLIIHLNRFEQRDSIMATKNPNFIDFPVEELDMSKLVVGDSRNMQSPRISYTLRGVCNHYGTMDGGHYTAYCSSDGSNWQKCDDHEVYDTSSSNVVTSAAYVLFYQARQV